MCGLGVLQLASDETGLCVQGHLELPAGGELLSEEQVGDIYHWIRIQNALVLCSWERVMGCMHTCVPRHKHKDVHCSVVYDRKRLETTHMTTRRRPFD